MTTAEVWIPLSQGKVAVIDFDDFEKVRPFKWHVSTDKKRSKFYVVRNVACGPGKQRRVKLHRELMQPGVGLEVDHRDGDGLNNRRGNLRVVTPFRNSINRKLQANKTSKYRGVSFAPACALRPWNAQISYFPERRGSKNLGYFQHEEVAARAYDAAAIIKYGNDAQLNFPVEVPRA